MKDPAQVARPVRPPAPTIHVVKFGQRPRRAPRREQPPPEGRVPRVARLLALAHRIDGMIRSGSIRDWAEAARLAGVTRARMTQIANLLLLSPGIQNLILAPPAIDEGNNIPAERRLRALTPYTEWTCQEAELHCGKLR